MAHESSNTVVRVKIEYSIGLRSLPVHAIIKSGNGNITHAWRKYSKAPRILEPSASDCTALHITQQPSHDKSRYGNLASGPRLLELLLTGDQSSSRPNYLFSAEESRFLVLALDEVDRDHATAKIALKA